MVAVLGDERVAQHIEPWFDGLSPKIRGRVRKVQDAKHGSFAQCAVKDVAPATCFKGIALRNQVSQTVPWSPTRRVP